MVHRILEIRVVSRQGSDGSRTQIRVTRSDGDTQAFGSLAEMPDDLRALAEPLFHPVAARGWRTGLLKRSKAVSLELGEPVEANPLAASRRAETSQSNEGSRRRRSREIIHPWFDLWAAGGGLAVTVFPLVLIRGVLFGNDPWTVWTFLALLVSVVGLYLMLAFLINHTRLTADANGLTVHHGPLPWLGNQRIAREDLRQLFVRVRSSSRTTEYRLCARTTSGTCELVGSASDPDALRQYEQELEDYFGIEDRPVRGNQYR